MKTEKKKKREKKKKYEKHSLNLHLFTNVIPVVTDQIPWGVDGTSIYKNKGVMRKSGMTSRKMEDGGEW